MAACVRRINNVLLSLRGLRYQQQPNGRFLSTSLPLFASGSDDTGRPPQFTPPAKPVIIDKTQTAASLRRFLSPEFVPLRQRINPLKAAIERKDMIRRRKVLNIPEFYVGSILAVTMTDQYASGKSNRFVGICIQRGGRGLGATFILRNIIENQGIEICYEMYSPLIQKIEVLRLEKRLDDNLMYLRDALPEYSTVDPDMKPVSSSPTGDVPINTIKVRMRPKPWSKRWERPKFNIKGIRFDLCLTSEQMEHAQKWAEPWREYDMLKEYDTSRLEESIMKEIKQEMRK